MQLLHAIDSFYLFYLHYFKVNYYNISIAFNLVDRIDILLQSRPGLEEF